MSYNDNWNVAGHQARTPIVNTVYNKLLGTCNDDANTCETSENNDYLKMFLLGI